MNFLKIKLKMSINNEKEDIYDANENIDKISTSRFRMKIKMKIKIILIIERESI